MTYAPVNGLQLYYEIGGSGRPLVLLHGGLLTIDLNFGPLLEPLAASRQVIAVELQGHGQGHGHTGVRTNSISPSAFLSVLSTSSSCRRSLPLWARFRARIAADTSAVPSP